MVKVTQIYKHVWITLHLHEDLWVVAEAEFAQVSTFLVNRFSFPEKFC